MPTAVVAPQLPITALGATGTGVPGEVLRGGLGIGMFSQT